MSLEEAKAVLGFPPGSSPSENEVEKARRQKAIENHPDRGGDPDKMVEVNVAADVLVGKQRPTGSPRPYSRPEPQGTPPPPGGWSYEPPPKQKDVEVTFEEAKSKAGIPSGVNWWFVTESHSSGYSGDESTRRATGYVVVGETENAWVFVTVEHFFSAYYYVGGGPKYDTYHMEVMKLPKRGKPEPAFLYGGVMKAWKNFEFLEKKFNSKIKPLPESWVFSERFPSSGSSTTIKKLLADKGLLSEEQAATIKTSVEMELETSLGEKPGFVPEPTAPGREPRDWYKITLWINGRPLVLSPQDTRKFFTVTNYGATSKILTVVFGTYWRHGGKKTLTRLRKGKELLTLMGEKLGDLPPGAKDALLATAARLK